MHTHFFGIHGIHHGNVIGKHRTPWATSLHTETIQRRKAFGPSWNTRANLPISCAFSNSMTLFPRQARQRGRRAADSATYNNCAACHVWSAAALFRLGFYLAGFSGAAGNKRR